MVRKLLYSTLQCTAACVVATGCVLVHVSACVAPPDPPDDRGPADNADDPSDSPLATARSETAGMFCPTGTWADTSVGYCVDDGAAYGPFTDAMTAACQASGGGSACVATRTFQIDGHTVQVPRWGRAFAAGLRGTGRCMVGAAYDASLGACVEGANAFGPFPVAILAGCVVNGGGDACYSNRWSESFYASLARRPRPNFGATSTLEYHDVVPGADLSLAPGGAVTAGHMQRLARQYSRSRHLITFDDGYLGVYQQALPELSAAQTPAVAAIIIDATRDSGSADALANHMSRAELTALVRSGWVLALHAGSSAEHELNYAREADLLRTGQITSATRSPATIDLADGRAADYLGDLTALPGGASERLLARLRGDRAAVVQRINGGDSDTEAATHVLADRLGAQRNQLAAQAGVPVIAVDTFIYPHSESNAMVRAAAARAGFARAYAGGGIGDPSDAFDLPRRWMNDQSDVP